MNLRSKITSMGMFPDVGKLQDALNEKFDKLYAVLIEIRDLLAQKGPPQ